MPAPFGLDVPLWCPYYGNPLAFEQCVEDVASCSCRLCGLLVLPPDGRIRRAAPAEGVDLDLDSQQQPSIGQDETQPD